jgi:ATP-dependent RNA helicase DeaD
MTEFKGIVPALAEALEKRGYAELTPVQKAVLAPEAEGADLLVSAQTGSGKTVAFGLALAPTLLDGAARFGQAGAPLALAVAPTRELAIQVKRELDWLYEGTGASVASCVGGMDMRNERRALERGAHIVVGTPGRLRDHITRNSLDMSGLRAVVLDEADEMLDLGFREDLEFILDAAPATRRTLLFSATIPRAIATLAKTYQRDAVRIATSAEQSQHVDIEYRALTVAGGDRENAIVNVLRYYEAKTALVFCSTRAAVNHMTARFNNRGFSVVAMSGELSQNERTHALQAMRDGRARVCVATDVAARGIDLPNLELVIHADLPTNPDTLKHRSGRTGRAGRKGVSVLIVPHSARRRTERLLQSATISAVWARPPSADDVTKRDDERFLADPAFADAVTEDEQGIVADLLSRHGPEQVAAAFVRFYRAGRSAPEELSEMQPQEGRAPRREAGPDYPVTPAGQREDFSDSVWFSLSVGRNQNAEPRWLIPMLCRAGQITKQEIGAIKMQQTETFVQISAGHADGFLAAIGPNRALERGIIVKRLDGAPELGRPSFGGAKRFSPRPDASQAPAGKSSTAPAGDAKPWAKKPKKAKFGEAPSPYAKPRRPKPRQS